MDEYQSKKYTQILESYKNIKFLLYISYLFY